MEWNKHKDRNRKIKELRATGWSVREIAAELQCSKAIVSYHCKGTEKLPGKQGGDGLITKIEWQRKIEAIKEQAKKEWEQLQYNPSFMGFLGLYWGEGNKNKVVGVTNNDPHVIRIAYENFVKWTNKVIVATITYYPLHDREICDPFWKQLLPTAELKFRNNTDKRSQARWCDRCKWGACCMRVSDYSFYWRLITWIECWKNWGVSEAGSR